MKYRIIKTRFVNLMEKGMHPTKAKHCNSQLHVMTSRIKQGIFFLETRCEQIIGKVIINGKSKYRIVEYLGKNARKFEGVLNQYKLIRI